MEQRTDIAANMDTVGTFAMARALAGFRMMTAIRQRSINEWQGVCSPPG